MGCELEVGETAKDFSLIGTDGLIYTWNAFKGYRAIVVFFTSNSCPYVLGSLEYLKKMAKTYRERNVLFVGINANSSRVDERESFERMCETKEEEDLPWIYLQDETKRTAKKFGAVCTPHFFLFNRTKHLVYSGRGLDDPRNPSRSSSDALKTALDELLDTMPISQAKTDPVGCSIKWDEVPSEEHMEELSLV